jgi:hypothetical protein
LLIFGEDESTKELLENEMQIVKLWWWTNQIN